jgi:hypothetical protein
MLKGNAATDAKNSDASFKLIISEARASHTRSKEGAAEAVANAYMLWIASQSPQATKEAREWFEKEVSLANEDISIHNEKVRAEADRVKKFKDGLLPSDDPVNEKPRDPTHAAEIEQMRDELRAKSGWERKDWARLRKVLIDAREGASLFNRCVKFVFGFDEAQHSDQVARYCLVMEWLHAQYAEHPPVDKDEAIKRIKEFGGFEDVLFEQRRLKSGENDDSADRAIMSDAIRADIKHALGNASPIATINHDARFEKEGFVMLLGRKHGGKVDLVSEIEMTDADLQAALTSVGPNINIPNPQNSEFVARVLELGKLVAEGQEINRTHDGTKSGEKIRVQRVVALRPYGDDGAEFVVSARSADASPIVHARPKNVEDLGQPDRPMMLGFQTRKRMEHFLRDANVRRHIEIKADSAPKRSDDTPADSPMAWIGGNIVLLGQSSKNAQQRFFWTDLLNIDQKPLDIENFQAQFEAGIDDVDLETLYDQGLKAWSAAKSPNKATMVAVLKFQDDKLLVRIGEQQELEFKLSTPVRGKFSLSFRMREFHDLFDLLRRQRANAFTLRGDEGGLMEVSWDDSLGSYSVFLPTVSQDGKLQSRRVAPMRVSAPPALAAE